VEPFPISRHAGSELDYGNFGIRPRAIQAAPEPSEDSTTHFDPARIIGAPHLLQWHLTRRSLRSS
jgi:hypothetical protein